MMEVGKAGESHGHDLCNDFFLFEKRTQYLNWDVTIGENLNFGFYNR